MEGARSNPVRSDLQYPLIEAGFTDRTGQDWFITSACFHAIYDSDLNEIAGMGLAIIGNVVKMVKSGDIPLGSRLWLKMRFAPNAEPIPLPWPGMKDDNPNLPGKRYALEVEGLPFDFAMFLGDNGHFQKRVNRLELLRRIREVWTPHVFGLMLQKI